ncbi:MAG: dihydroneopterin aldolase, partial [Firmicutes bacterium]|nr:dihydroneopterin aldolase [Bacillota bacterium]
GRHGVYAEERSLGQRFVISLWLTQDLRPAAAADDLALTVNYGDVYNRVREIVEGPPCKLLETLGERICARLLAEFEDLSSVRVRVEKPGAPIAGIFASVGVEFLRERSRGGHT